MRYFFFFLLLIPLTPWIDHEMTAFFYHQGRGSVEHFVVHPIFEFLYDYGPTPAIAVASLSIPFLILKKSRKAALYLILTFTIGSVLVTNLVLKDHYGRPRPRQVETYGGYLTYRPLWSPNLFNRGLEEPCKSFPCGHATSGFYFLSFIFLGRRMNKPWLERFGWVAGVGFGALLGLTRIAQGGHFFSDVAMSAFVMGGIAYLFDQAIFQTDKSESGCGSF